MTISRFHFAEMDCAAEEQLVRIALSDIDGINRVSVDLDQRDVVIDHDTSPDVIGTALDALRLGTSHIDNSSEIAPPGNERRERSALVFAFVINAAFFFGELTVGVIGRSMGSSPTRSTWARTQVCMRSAWPLSGPQPPARNSWRAPADSSNSASLQSALSR